MLDKFITFGGDRVPAYIASAPQVVRPARKMSVTPIAGTSREVVEMEDAWETYDQPYTLFVGDGTANSIQQALRDVARVLYKTGWQVLLDDYEPNYFRMAYYQGPFDVENRRTFLGKFDISFKCRAERYLVSGNTPTSVASGGKITNPTSFNARPLIHVEGSGDGTLIIAGQTVGLTGIVDYLNIDCDVQDVYRLSSENRNSHMTGDFPVLFSGDNNVTFTGGITAVTITPRFWVI